MRENYTDREKQLMKSFVELKNNNDFAKLQVAYWIKDYLDCFALSWEIQPQCKLTFYRESQVANTKLSFDKNYQKLVDFIYFIQELKTNGFIKYQYSTASQKENTIRQLYDTRKYTYSDKLNIFFQKSEDNSNLVTVKLASKSVVHLDFAKDLEECYNAIIYPLPVLKNFVNNNFVIEEKKRFNKSLRATYIATGVALLIGLKDEIINIICNLIDLI